MIGTNSSGARTVAYGATKDHVLALETVLADASTFRAQPRSLAPAATSTEAPPPADSLAERAIARLLPRLEAQQHLIASRMPAVVKNCSGYRLESILQGPKVESSNPAASSCQASDTKPITAHLQRLFVGAEGTLGLVTEATLNLVPLPSRRGIAMAYFPSVFASGEAVPGILRLGPTAVEIMDARFLAVVRAHDSHVDAMLPPRTDTALLIEFEGRDEAELESKFAALSRHLSSSNIIAINRPRDERESERFWAIRKSAVALALRMPGPRRALPFIEDVTVHPTEVPGYVDFLQRLFDRAGIQAFMYGHVGDGNIHTRPLLDPKDPATAHHGATLR
jgi:FAD/FMN-containing dehydrogenase